MPIRKNPPFELAPPRTGFTTVGDLVADLQTRPEWRGLKQRRVADFAVALYNAAVPLRKRAKPTDLRVAEAEILRVLRMPDVDAWDAKAIYEAITADVSEATVHNILRRLIKSGAVVQSGRTHGTVYAAAVLDGQLTLREAWDKSKICDYFPSCGAPLRYGHEVCPECKRIQNRPRFRAEAAA